MALLQALRNGQEFDFLREGLSLFLHELMQQEVSAAIGAERYERTEERSNQRNGTRHRPFDTRLGTIDLAIPKLRSGSYFPVWLEPRRRAEQALVAVVAEAYLKGVSTRKVEDLVQSLGIAGMSKSEVSRLCVALDAQVEAFCSRRLDAEYPYVFLDARYEHVREDERVQAMAVVIAYAIRADGVREVLAIAVHNAEDLAHWREFLQGLLARGVRGVKLVTSDAHSGLKRAIAEVFLGATWQRCRVHFVRNLLARVPKNLQPMVAATVRPIFQQNSRGEAQATLAQVCSTLSARFPKVVELLAGAEEDILAFYDFPKEHWRQIYSTNPLERVNKELKRRSAVVGIFPNRASVVRLLGSLLVEQNDEWLVGRRYFSEASMRKITDQQPEPAAAVAVA